MSVSAISDRYAGSLLSLAKEKGNLKAVFEDIQSLKEVILDNRDLQLLMASPIIKPSKKRSISKKLFGEKVDDLTLKFLDVVIRKGRENQLIPILTAFEEMFKKEMGISTVVLTSASPLSQEFKSALKEKLKPILSLRQQVEFLERIDNSLIGGFIVEGNGKRIDLSVEQKLKDLRNQFSSN